jgi:hypothetical protein
MATNLPSSSWRSAGRTRRAYTSAALSAKSSGLSSVMAFGIAHSFTQNAVVYCTLVERHGDTCFPSPNGSEDGLFVLTTVRTRKDRFLSDENPAGHRTRPNLRVSLFPKPVLAVPLGSRGYRRSHSLQDARSLRCEAARRFLASVDSEHAAMQSQELRVLRLVELSTRS